MSDDHEAPTLSLARYPDPACSYEFVDADPVLGATNEPFAELCDAGSGESLNTALDRLELCGPEPTFDRETQFHAKRNGTEFTVRVIPPQVGESGYLLFTAAAGEECEAVGVDRVATVISHDLRNPLDVARARLRAGRELDSDEHFEHVQQAHDRMERIIQDVLTLARGEDVVDPDESVDLGSVAADAWETVETDGASLEVVDDLPVAEADRDRVSRLFENLFRNAVEHGSTSPRSHAPEDAVEHGSTSPESHAPEDAVEHGSTSPDSQARQDPVEHGADGSDEQTAVVVGSHADGFYVADNGPGIPESEWDDIFEPGYTASEHGTGLGLSIVEQIAQLHGWSIDVGHAEAGGARFEISGVDPN